MLASGLIPEGIPGPPEVLPDDTAGAREEAAGLAQAIAYYRASPGPVIPHRRFGSLTRAEWDQFQLMHLAHHRIAARKPLASAMGMNRCPPLA